MTTIIFNINKNYLDESYDLTIKSFIYIKFRYFKEVCDQIYDHNYYLSNNISNDESYIQRNIKYFDSFPYNDNKEIIKYKIDCLTDYVIMKRSNGDVICFGQNNILNINKLMPCQIYFMRINYKTFEDLFTETTEITEITTEETMETQRLTETNNNIFNISNANEITDDYIIKLKNKVKVIIKYIISKLNYENKYEDVQAIIEKKIKCNFPYEEVIYPDNKKKVNELQINSIEERTYWFDTLRIYLKEMEINIKDKINKVNYCKNIYNFNYKYIHLVIQNKNFLASILSKLKELKFECYKMIYENITNIKLDNIANTYNNIIQSILYALNSFNRVEMLIMMDKDSNLVYRI